jgi:hypothetical protein
MDEHESQNPLLNPVLRYGMATTSAAVVLVIAFLFLDGTARLVAVGIAVLEALVTPMILKRAGEVAPAET